jgi:hypothetical protein
VANFRVSVSSAPELAMLAIAYRCDNTQQHVPPGQQTMTGQEHPPIPAQHSPFVVSRTRGLFWPSQSVLPALLAQPVHHQQSNAPTPADKIGNTWQNKRSLTPSIQTMPTINMGMRAGANAVRTSGASMRDTNMTILWGTTPHACQRRTSSLDATFIPHLSTLTFTA